MNASAIKNGLKATSHALFGSPDLPPLGQKAFMRAALFVFLVRLPATECAMRLFFGLSGIDIYQAEDLVGWHFLVGAFILCTFWAPYFRVIHRRLLGIGMPRPAPLVCLAIIIVCLYYYYSPDKYQWYWYFMDIAFFSSIYFILIPWPDHSSGRHI